MGRPGAAAGGGGVGSPGGARPKPGRRSRAANVEPPALTRELASRALLRALGTSGQNTPAGLRHTLTGPRRVAAGDSVYVARGDTVCLGDIARSGDLRRVANGVRSDAGEITERAEGGFHPMETAAAESSA